MKKAILIILVCAAIPIAGCDEFWQKGDKIVTDVNNIASGAQAVLDSPAGQMIPPDLKLYGLLGIGLINGIVIGWEEWRNRTMKKITTAIVKGIEDTGKPDDVTSNIAGEMRRQGGDKFYDRANKIVDRLKIS